MLVQLLTGWMTGSCQCLFSGPPATYQPLRRGAFRIEAMGRTVEEKARWARGKAAGLWARVNALDAISGGDWQARARRQRAAGRLVQEAARYERMAAGCEGRAVDDGLNWDLPF